MKKIIISGIIMLFAFFGLIVFDDKAFADEEKIKILFELNTPEEFSEEIRIKTRNLETGKRYTFSFAEGSDYSSFLKVPPGEYSLEVEFEEGSFYTSTAKENYYFEKEEQLVTFDIVLQKENSEEDASSKIDIPVNTEETVMPTGEVYVEVKHPIYVYNDFLERFSYIEHDEYLNGFRGLFNKSESSRRSFLESNFEHNDEMFDNMSGYEQFIWEKIIFWPREDLENAPYSFENYRENSAILSLLKTKFVDDIKPGYEGKEEAYYAIEDVWKWYYDYYEKTGEIFNFEEQEWFSIDTIAYIQDPSMWTDSDTMKVKLFGTELTVEAQEMLSDNSDLVSEFVKEETSAKDVEEESSIAAEKPDDEEQDTIFSLIGNWLIKNVFTTILILILCVVVIVLFIKSKKKEA